MISTSLSCPIVPEIDAILFLFPKLKFKTCQMFSLRLCHDHLKLIRIIDRHIVAIHIYVVSLLITS